MRVTHQAKFEPVGSLWPLPLAAGLLPAIAALAALWLSIALAIFPACNPFIDGCVSISRAARTDLPNQVFRALVLPAAVLQALTWVACYSWLKEPRAVPPAVLRMLPWLGVLAGLFLVLYGSFLGTEGQAYRWMRRYGVIFYFGFTFLCMAITSGELRRRARSGSMALPGHTDRLLAGLCVVTLATGLSEVFLPPFMNDEESKNRLENILEWYAALGVTLFFLALAWLWRQLRLPPRLTSDSRGNPPTRHENQDL